MCGTCGFYRMMHGGVSDPSFCAFIHRVPLEEVSGHRVLLTPGCTPPCAAPLRTAGGDVPRSHGASFFLTSHSCLTSALPFHRLHTRAGRVSKSLCFTSASPPGRFTGSSSALPQGHSAAPLHACGLRQSPRPHTPCCDCSVPSVPLGPSRRRWRGGQCVSRGATPRSLPPTGAPWA